MVLKPNYGGSAYVSQNTCFLSPKRVQENCAYAPDQKLVIIPILQHSNPCTGLQMTLFTMIFHGVMNKASQFVG